MYRPLLLTAITILLASPALAQQATGAKPGDGDSCLMYGKDHMFAIKAPTGWIVDPATGQKLGLHAVMYPKGSSWREASATMYTNFVHKGSDAPTIEQIIADDIAGYKKDSPSVIVADADSVPLGTGKEKVVVKSFRNDKGNNVEMVAYIDENKVVIMIVLSAPTEKDFLSALPLFKEMVHSYRFVSDTVTIGNQ
jgi:hypothetical protein